MKIHASTPQIIAINARLAEVLIAGTSSCSYKKDHSDVTVANEFGLKSHHVARIRKEMYGELTRGSPPGKKSARIDRLELGLIHILDFLDEELDLSPLLKQLHEELMA